MTVAGMGLVLCAAAALEIEEEENKRKEEARRRVQVKRRKKVKDWLRRKVQLGYTNWKKKILPASRTTSEWTHIHLMRFWRESHPE